MNKNNRIEVWQDFNEEFILQLLEEAFQKQGYDVENLHRTDRPHEFGIDLLCEKEQEEIAIQIKIKPRKSDIKQFDDFVNSTTGKKAIYVIIQNPTRPFSEHVKGYTGKIEFWDVNQLHKFMVRCEIREYFCIYFSKHPLVLALAKVHNLISEKRGTSHVQHRLSTKELDALWAAKDNSVKARISIYLIYQIWNTILRAKTVKDKDEFESILQSIFDQLDIAYALCGSKLMSSFEDLSKRYPNILGLLWELASHRTGWSTYTTFIENSDSLEKSKSFTLYHWICPVFDDFSMIPRSMIGFYSSMGQLLFNLHMIAKNIEDALDWVFSEMNRD